MINRLTINEFRAAYPNDDTCLDKLFQLRYSNLECRCGNDQSAHPFTKVKNRRSYQCPACGFQIYPTQGTVFEKTTTPLTSWFYAMYLQTTTRNGVAAKELERQLHICYKTALRMAHQIKILMGNRVIDMLTGIVEIDETYVGGKIGNKHKKVRAAYKEDKSSVENKIGVMGFLSRGNDIKMEVMTDLKTFKERVKANVDKAATIVTDSHNAYIGLNIDFVKHEIINHIENEYKRGDYHTNSIEGAWSQLKRTIKGTHIHVSVEHLQKYVDEVAFRYRYRHEQKTMFETILSHVV